MAKAGVDYRRDLLKAFGFRGEAKLPPYHIFNQQEPYVPSLINGFITDDFTIKNQSISDIVFIGKAKVPPLHFTFRALAREWEVKDNILIYSKPFGKLIKGDLHFQDESLKPIIFDSLINAVSISPSGETPRWGLYISTYQGVYELRFSGSKPVISRVIDASACGSIGVFTLEKSTEDLVAGTQVCVIPTKVGIYLATSSGIKILTPQESDVLKDIDYVHIALKNDTYGQYLLFLTAPYK